MDRVALFVWRLGRWVPERLRCALPGSRCAWCPRRLWWPWGAVPTQLVPYPGDPAWLHRGCVPYYRAACAVARAEDAEHDAQMRDLAAEEDADRRELEAEIDADRAALWADWHS